ncbi:hypothetical protein NQZ68_002476 [Dissostichus eleginoides]|nr:hypothetical protein NQZ68_002476 [Dissostichus eleginoides]
MKSSVAVPSRSGGRKVTCVVFRGALPQVAEGGGYPPPLRVLMWGEGINDGHIKGRLAAALCLVLRLLSSSVLLKAAVTHTTMRNSSWEEEGGRGRLSPPLPPIPSPCHAPCFMPELPQHRGWLEVMERMRQSIGCRRSKFQEV